VEVLVAALAQSEARLIEEMADLIYHSLVLLETRDVRWADVVAELEKRHK
jgi:phosphoribosyl-ATP pyrophosphohydrolase